MTIFFRKIVLTIVLVLATLLNIYAQKPEWIRNSEAVEGENGQTRGGRVAVHPDGSIFVFGQYSGSNTLNGQSLIAQPNTFSDSFLAKYNPNGDLLWLKQVFLSSEQYANRVIDVKIDNEGDLVFSGTCLYETSVLGSTIGIGPFIAKMNKDGVLIWLNFEPTYSRAEHDLGRRGNRIQFDSNYNILWLTDQITGYVLDGGLAVVKYNSTGLKLATMFVTQNPPPIHTNIQDISANPDGSFIIAGNYRNSVELKGGPLLTNNGSNFNPLQLFVAKFTAEGDFLWEIHSDKGSNLVASQTTDNNGNLYISLQSRSGATIYTPKGELSFTNGDFIIKVSEEGEIKWLNQVNNTNVEDIVFSQDGLLYLTGDCWGNEFKYQSYVKPKSSYSSSSFILKINTAGYFYGFYMGEPEEDSSTPEVSSVYDGYQSVVDTYGNIYTIGGFTGRHVWGCVPAVTKEYAFYLVKHSRAESPIHKITGPVIGCDESEITLSTNLVSNGVLYKWFTPERADPDPGTTNNNIINFIAKQTYHNQTVIVSITDNCDEYFAEPYILNIQSPPQKPEVTMGKSLVCPGTSELYKIAITEDGVNYDWVLPDGIMASDLGDSGGTLFFDSNFIEGNIKVLASNYCGTIETVFNINTYKTPDVPILTGDQTICPDISEIEVSIAPVSNAISYEWKLPTDLNFNPSYENNLTTLHAIVENDFQIGEIKVTAVGQCKSSPESTPIIISRTINPENATSIVGSEKICLSEKNVIFSLPSIEFASEYAWTVPDIFESPRVVITTEPYLSLETSNAGTGILSVYGSNNCNVNGAESYFSITIYAPLPTPVLTISECDSEITVNQAENFFWYINGIHLSNLSNKTISLTDSGIYHVETQNYCGLETSNLIQAYPVLNPLGLIPNVITPNGDGKNDLFTIDKSLANSSVNIMNRWGQTIFSSSDYKNDWGGINVTSGTYFVALNNQCLPQGYKGWLSIIK